VTADAEGAAEVDAEAAGSEEDELDELVVVVVCKVRLGVVEGVVVVLSAIRIYVVLYITILEH